MFFKQCQMSKPLGKSKAHQTAWIPEEFAHVGKVVKVHIQGDVWSDGWTIDSVGVRQDETHVLAHERDSDGHWKKLGT